MTPTWTDDGFTCCLSTSAAELPEAVWDERIAACHPLKTSHFMRCVEQTFTERDFAYLTVWHETRLVGMAVLIAERYDLALLLPRWLHRMCGSVRRVFPAFFTLRLCMVGTFETAKRHWWHDRAVLPTARFGRLLLIAAERAFHDARLLVVRDFDDQADDDKELLQQLVAGGCRAVPNLPLATLRLDGLSIDQHLARLKRKSRATVRNALRSAAERGVRVERVREFGALIDECYPLYVQVHERASEFRRQPIPKTFFHNLAAQLPQETSLLTARDAAGQLLGFTIAGTSNEVHNPIIIGMDYRYSRELSLYYVLLWNELAYAVERGCREVDLGLTCYFVKQTLGASLEALSMAARVQVGWLRPVLNPLLPVLIGERQPRERQKFKRSETIEE